MHIRVTFRGGSVSRLSLYMHFFTLKTVQPLVFQTNHPVFHSFCSKSGYYLAIYGHFEQFIFQIFANCQQQWIEVSVHYKRLPCLPSCQLGGGGRQRFRKFSRIFTSLLKSCNSCQECLIWRLDGQVVQLSVPWEFDVGSWFELKVNEFDGFLEKVEKV